MKKIVAFLALMVMSVCCVFACADSELTGTWFYERETKGPYYYYDLLHLFEDGTGYNSSNIVDSGLIDEDPINILFTWEPCDVGIKIYFANGFKIYYLQNDGRLSSGKSFAPTVYSKLNSITQNPTQNSSQSSSITVPSGVYIAGEDFPAGIYRIDLADENHSGNIRLYENMAEVKEAFSYIYDYDLGSYYGTVAVGKIVIEEGNALEVRRTTVVLSPYEGLK